MKIPKLLLIIATFFIASPNYAQKRPIKYGKVDMELMEMDVLPGFESASAAVICQYGIFDAQAFRFTQLVRLKIFKKSGYEEANFTFNRIHSSHSVRGKTFNLDNGEIVETKLTREGIFTEKISDDFSRLKVAMPNVKVGSVIDVEFSFDGLPPEWYFQKTIPVVWSELRIAKSEFINYKKISRGYEPLAEVSPRRWVAKNMPPAKDEPFVDNLSNYMTKFQMEVSSVVIPGYVYSDYSSSWGAVGGFYKRNTFFGDIMRDGSSRAREYAKIILSEDLDEEQRLNRAVSLVREKLKWNGVYSDLCSEHDIDFVVKKGEGNTADMNILLAKVLQEMGLRAHPVVLSTKDNGSIIPSFPTLAQFNYTIVQCTIGTEKRLVDASDVDAQPGLLPPHCIGTEGRQITKEIISRVGLDPSHTYKVKETNDIKMDENGNLTGNFQVKYDGYAAYEFRKGYEDESEYEKKLEHSYKGIDIEKVSIEGKDTLSRPISEIRTFLAEDRLLDLGDSYYLDPLFFSGFTENPFKEEQRVYPINFDYPRSYVHSTKLEFPENMKAETLPEPMRLYSPDKSMSFFFQCSGFGNKIMITYKIDFSKHFYLAQDYPIIKEMFEQISTKLKEGIILKTVD